MGLISTNRGRIDLDVIVSYACGKCESTPVLENRFYSSHAASIGLIGIDPRAIKNAMSIIKELKRRNVTKVAVAYAVAAWLIIQVVDTVFPQFGFPIWTMKFITVLLVIAFPLVLVTAWAFRVTPDGVKKETASDASAPDANITNRKLYFAVMGLMAAAITFLIVDRFYRSNDPSIQPSTVTTIAVLPFVSLSSGADDGYFADGLTEEILNTLAQLPELYVTARTTSFFFKGRNLPLSEIAERINVAHIVEGSVRRNGNQLRITAQLIRAADGYQLWSQSYDRVLEDVFLVQRDIAENISSVLGVVLDDNARQLMGSVGARNVEAFIAFQKGRRAWERAHNPAFDTLEWLAIANDYFDKALETSPDLTAARFLKAELGAHILLSIAIGRREEKYSGEAADTLEVLLDEYDEAWRITPPGNQRDIIALERTLFSNDWSGLPNIVQRAMKPGRCPQMNWVAEFLGPFGLAEQVANKAREALACDPMDAHANDVLPRMLITAGAPKKALEELAKANNRGVYTASMELRRYEALLAASLVDDPRAIGPWPQANTADWDREILREALSGDIEAARKMAEEYWANPGSSDATSLRLAAALGDRALANEIASRIDAHPGSALVICSAVVLSCQCGAPFDLDAAPNFKSRIEEAGFPWPPTKRIDYPAKNW